MHETSQRSIAREAACAHNAGAAGGTQQERALRLRLCRLTIDNTDKDARAPCQRSVTTATALKVSVCRACGDVCISVQVMSATLCSY